MFPKQHRPLRMVLITNLENGYSEMKEVWRDIVEYEDLYEVSNLGRVRSLIWHPKKILSRKTGRKDYVRLPLSKKGVCKTVLVHRVVYEAFKGAIPKGFQIHHKDGNKQNNRLSNLEAISTAYHSQVTRQANPLMFKKSNETRSIPILQYALDGSFITEYPSAKIASEKTGICRRNINQVANRELNQNGKIRKQAGGFIWRYKK